MIKATWFAIKRYHGFPIGPRLTLAHSLVQYKHMSSAAIARVTGISVYTPAIHATPTTAPDGPAIGPPSTSVARC